MPDGPENPENPENYVEFCGERFPLEHSRPFYIGRDGHLTVDEDNPYLHRRFLQIQRDAGLWWLTNRGKHLSATVASGNGAFNATLGPGARMTLVSGRTSVVFRAGSTTYEVHVHTAEPELARHTDTGAITGDQTLGVPKFTESQLLLVLALAEEMLRREGTPVSAIPSSRQAADRLGWSLTKFNRKLDNVCDKLDLIGVPGMRAGGGRPATNRRVSLVEYALATGLVGRDDLALIDAEIERNKPV